VVPSNPSEAEAFRNFLGKQGFANVGESCEGEYKKEVLRMRKRRKVGCSLTCVIK
jgi:hypothetical protein